MTWPSRRTAGQGVVDLGDRADGAPARQPAARSRDRDGRRDAVDAIRVGLVHLLEELAGIGREGLDVPALTLGVEGVEGQRALARTADPRDGDQPVRREVDVDALEVMGPDSAEGDGARCVDGCLLPVAVSPRSGRRSGSDGGEGAARTRTSVHPPTRSIGSGGGGRRPGSVKYPLRERTAASGALALEAEPGHREAIILHDAVAAAERQVLDDRRELGELLVGDDLAERRDLLRREVPGRWLRTSAARPSRTGRS